MTTAAQLAQMGSPGTSLGFKNRIINGAMVIDQRNAGASVTVNDANNRRFPVDRTYGIGTNTAGVFTLQQSSTAPAGFVNSIVATVTTTAASPGTSDSYVIGQIIEGLNIADLGWGSSNAAAVTMSFWVRSSITGTFGGSLRNNAIDRSYPFSYTISSANTWEQKFITIPGDTTGTWLTTNGIGIRIVWSLGAGSTVSGTANTWAATTYNTVTGAINLMATNGATFYITGVQLEKGSIATPFDFRDYGRELQMCQRYYEQMTADSTQSIGGYGRFITGGCGGSGIAYGTYTFPVLKRAAPSLVYGGTFRLQISAGSDTSNTTSMSLVDSRPYSATIFINAGTGGTAGYHGVYQFMTSTSYVGFSAEL